MHNPEKHTCHTCGYTWRHGTHGGHDCSIYLDRTIKELKEGLEEKDNRILELDSHLKGVRSVYANLLVESLCEKLERDPWMVDYLDPSLKEKLIDLLRK